MEFRRKTISFIIVFLSCLGDFGTAVDIITASQPVKDPGTITSNGDAFKLGFFNLTNSSNRYVGIWFDKVSEPVVWVANRNNPLNGTSGVITIENGNLVILNGQNQLVWSSNISNAETNVTAQFLDSGNLVLHENTTGRIIWESFQVPTDTLLQGMKLTSSKTTGRITQLTSRGSPSDMSPGSFTFGVDASNIPEAVIWNGSQPYQRKGQWNGQHFIGIRPMSSFDLDGLQLLVDEGADVVSFSFTLPNAIVFYVLTSEGILEEKFWDEEENTWKVGFQSLVTECDVYGRCGLFGNCDAQTKPICNCLRGFEVKEEDEWSSGNWGCGCVRKKVSQCEMANQTGEVGEKDGFLKLQNMKLPYLAERSSVPVEICKEECLNNCSCTAYAYVTGIGCMQWTGSLNDLNQFPSEGEDLYIRLPQSELEDKDDKKVVIIVPTVVGIVIAAICTIFLCRWISKRKALKVLRKYFVLDKRGASGENNEFELQDLLVSNLWS